MRRAARRRRAGGTVWLLLTLGWLMLVAWFSFIREPDRPRPEEGPSTWKFVLWVVCLLAFPAALAIPTLIHGV